MKNIIERLKVLPADKRTEKFIYDGAWRSGEFHHGGGIRNNCG